MFYCYYNFRLTTLIDVKKTMEYLAYLGYMYEHDNQLSAIHGLSSLSLSFIDPRVAVWCIFSHVLVSTHVSICVCHYLCMHRDNLGNACRVSSYL